MPAGASRGLPLPKGKRCGRRQERGLRRLPPVQALLLLLTLLIFFTSARKFAAEWRKINDGDGLAVLKEPREAPSRGILSVKDAAAAFLLFRKFSGRKSEEGMRTEESEEPFNSHPLN